MTQGVFVREAAAALSHLYPEEEARAVAERLLLHQLAIPYYRYLTGKEAELSDGDAGELEAALAELRRGRPLQYVLGFAEFCGHRFRVKEGVLIPRPETEELTQLILDDCREEMPGGEGEFHILDIGTGSGCIAWSLAAALPWAGVYGCDLSEEALKVACRQRLKGARPFFFASDVLASPPAGLPRFDVIVSNPPYVRESERAQMRLNVTGFEPAEALFVPDSDPLRYYRAIARWCSLLLHENGRIYLEVNEELAGETAALFPGSQVLRDFRGRDRFVVRR